MNQVPTPRDLVISAYTGYDWPKIKYWANSLCRSGFRGDKIVIAYNSDRSTVDNLSELGFKVLAFGQDPSGTRFICPYQPLNIVVQRFYDLWNFLNQLPLDAYRYVIATDIKDVIFQKNPSDWISANINNHELIASSESLYYKDEPWGEENLRNSFPQIYPSLRNNIIWNCGVQAGTQAALKDMWLQIWLTSHAGKVHNPDQAAYNLLLNSMAWKRITCFTDSESGWAAQAGTTVDPSKIINFRPHLLDPEPVWSDGAVYTKAGIKHTIVHQWDRVPAWKTRIEEYYG